MHLDMMSSSSVQSFVKKASTELNKIDDLVVNVDIMIDAWSTSENMKISIIVNVINTLFLPTLMMPKLSESARKFEIHPTIFFVVSMLEYAAKDEMNKYGKNDEARKSHDLARFCNDHRDIWVSI